MTKPTGTLKTHLEQTQPKTSSPKKYTVFYLILLIFTAINAALGLTGFAQIGDSLKYINDAPVLTCITFGQYISVLLMVAGVVYLYKKRKDGLYLLFGSYAFLAITMIILPFVSEPLVQEAVKQIMAQEPGRISIQDAEDFARIGVNGIAVINTVSSLIFAFLWNLAWNKQAKRDALNKTSE